MDMGVAWQLRCTVRFTLGSVKLKDVVLLIGLTFCSNGSHSNKHSTGAVRFDMFTKPIRRAINTIQAV